MSEDAAPETFEDIYSAYSDRVLNLAYRLTGDEEIARDLCQEIFVKVYENLARFEQRSQVFTWIYRISINHITNYIKKERRRRLVPLTDKELSDVARDPNAAFRGGTIAPSSQGKLERAERARIVWEVIQSLDPKYRVPLVLHHYDDISYKEIAEAMQLSMSAVESRIHRAKKQLISKLEPWLDKI